MVNIAEDESKQKGDSQGSVMVVALHVLTAVAGIALLLYGVGVL